MESGAAAPNRLPPDAFRYQPESNCYVCPEGHLLHPQGKYHGKKKPNLVAYFYEANISECQACIRKAECCPENQSHGHGLVRRIENAAVRPFGKRWLAKKHRHSPVCVEGSWNFATPGSKANWGYGNFPCAACPRWPPNFFGPASPVTSNIGSAWASSKKNQRAHDRVG